jgi:MFS family permease
MLIGIVNAFFTVVVFFFIDRIGRRSLLLIGISGMAFSMALLSISLAIQMSYLTLFSLFFYIASFAISLGPVLGIFLSEIFPQKIRGRAMGVAFFANWASNFIVSLTFLTLVYTIGIVFTFSLFTIICLIALWFVWKMIPETKGKTFEEIQKFWS